MSIALLRNPRAVVPDLVDWFEEPFLTLRPYVGQAIRIEDYIEDGQYVVRAERPPGSTRKKSLRSRPAAATSRSARSGPARSRASTARSSGTGRSAARSNSRPARTPRT